jgi:hypothetical protein
MYQYHNPITGKFKHREQRWNKVRQRLASITTEGLDIAFISCPVHNKTTYSEFKIKFFKITLNGEIIWIFPKDSEQPEVDKMRSLYYDDNTVPTGTPISSIIKYLDLPKEELLHYEDKAGIADILKVCDKRIGYSRLKELELSSAARKVFEERFKNKNIRTIMA